MGHHTQRTRWLWGADAALCGAVGSHGEPWGAVGSRGVWGGAVGRKRVQTGAAGAGGCGVWLHRNPLTGLVESETRVDKGAP